MFNVVYIICFWWILEPGYYEVGSFGIRLETLVSVVKANTKVWVDYSLFIH